VRPGYPEIACACAITPRLVFAGAAFAAGQPPLWYCQHTIWTAEAGYEFPGGGYIVQRVAEGCGERRVARPCRRPGPQGLGIVERVCGGGPDSHSGRRIPGQDGNDDNMQVEPEMGPEEGPTKGEREAEATESGGFRRAALQCLPAASEQTAVLPGLDRRLERRLPVPEMLLPRDRPRAGAVVIGGL